MERMARTAWPIVRVVILVAAFTLLDHTRPVTGQSADEQPASLLRIQEGGLLYTYHVVTGTEALFDTARDPTLLRNLAPQRPRDAHRLRQVLAQRFQVDDLDSLREGHRDEIRILRSLGYL